MKKYTADDIQVLEGLEAVRQSPSIYLGSKNLQVLHMLKEVYENCVDLFLKGMNNYITVLIDNNKEQQNFVIIDSGPGIPVSKHKQTGESTLTGVFTTLSMGSNFKRDGKKKEISRGNHGVGVSCVNAVSKRLQVWTCRHNQWFTQIFEKGKVKTEVTKCKFPSQFIYIAKNCGTIVQYTPDYTIVPKTILKEKEVYEFIKRNAELNTGLKVRFISSTIDEIICNKKGISFILDNYKKELSATTLGKPFIFESKYLDVAFQWSDKVGSDNFLSFVNGSLTAEGGTHLNGLYEIIGRIFKKLDKRDFSFSDLRNGLLAIIHYKTTNQVDYTSQDKSKLDSPEATKIVKELLEQPLKDWISKNKNTVKKVIKRAIDIRKVELESKKMIKAASSLKNKNKTLNAKKLIQCSKKCPSNEIELFIVEGTSAAGSASKARNPYNQEILKCRGKGLNVFRCTLSKALQNDEIKSFLTAVGASDKDIKNNQQVSNIRVGKILLFSDPDIDAPLRGDTKLLTLNGEQTTIEELANKWKKDKQPIWLLGRDKHKNIMPVQGYAPTVKKITKKYYQITFTDGTIINCTGNHPWCVNKSNEYTFKRNGLNYCETQYLKIGDSINSVYLEKRLADGSFSYKGEHNNHKIKDIKIIRSKKPIKFYCLTVPETGNFFVADKNGNGILSSNCHIDILWLTWIYKFCKSMLEQGRVFKVNVPLYQAIWHDKKGDHRIFKNTLDSIYKEAPKSATVTRFKGLGECMAEQLEQFINPTTRDITQITLPQAQEKINNFLKILGDDVSTRKKLLGIKERKV